MSSQFDRGAGPPQGHAISSLGDTAGVGIALLVVAAVTGLIAAGALLGGALTRATAAFIVGGVFAVLAAGFALGSRRPLQISARFEPGVLFADRPSWTLGSSGSGRFRRVVKKGSTDVRSISAHLLLEEWVRWREGTDTRTATREIHRYPVELQRQIDPQAVVADLSWQLPAFPPSFKSGDNEVRWRLIVDVVMADGFEEDSIVPLWVNPWTMATGAAADGPVDSR